MTTGALPRLVGLVDQRSVDTRGRAGAGRGECEMVWLVESAGWPVGDMGPLLERLGRVVDIAGLAPGQVSPRPATREAGLPAPGTVRLRLGSSADDVAEQASTWTFPVVVKPVRGRSRRCLCERASAREDVGSLEHLGLPLERRSLFDAGAVRARTRLEELRA